MLSFDKHPCYLSNSLRMLNSDKHPCNLSNDLLNIWSHQIHIIYLIICDTKKNNNFYELSPVGLE